ncbi:MAG: tetratricopeptide repeat protein [Candidatus Omnitrophota bacterium]|nr:tetratricopeptide repeat protein [Candidatus Omnitrophota bacterium]
MLKPIILFRAVSKILAVIFIINFVFFCRAQAGDAEIISSLTQKIIGTENLESAYPAFEELTESYFSARRYNEYADLLKNLAQKKKELEPAVDYYAALTRYYQLKYLEDAQSWDEYFNKGNDYRGQIKDSLDRAIQATALNADVYGLNARLLLWKFYKGKQDDAGTAALSGLMDYISRYAAGNAQNLLAIKEAGYELLSFNEKIKAKMAYEIYAEKLLSSGVSHDELGETALKFYKEGNLGLAESIYNLYIEQALKTMPPEKSAPLLMGIGRLFLYGRQKPYDAFYAETILAKAEEVAGIEIFDEGLMYLRALSLEKTRQFERARAAYDNFTARFPGSRRANEAAFKSAFIGAYALGELKDAKARFVNLAAGISPDAYTAAGLYQLGLFSQWENDLAGAKDYYSRALSVGAGLSRPANKEFGRDPALGQDSLAGKSASTMAGTEQSSVPASEVAVLAQERLNEIAGPKPMEYNLKMFLDTVINNGANLWADASTLGLSADSYTIDKNEFVFISSTAVPLESGCVQVSIEYLWSGQSGKTKPSSDSFSFNTSYDSPGPKIINLVAVSPTGLMGWDFALIDVE